MQALYHATITVVCNHILLTPTTKRCVACLQFKPFDDFHNEQSKPDGLKTICKPCRKNPAVRSYGSRNGDLTNRKICTKCTQEKHISEFGEGMGQCKQCMSEQRHQHRLDNHEYYLEYDRKRSGNPERNVNWRNRYQEIYAFDPVYMEKKRQSNKRWDKANRLKKREHLLRYNANKRRTTVESVSYESILKRDGYWCYICGEDIDPTIKKGPSRIVFDHVVPLVPQLGNPQGTHTADNIKPAHQICNRRKSNKRLESLTPFERRGL